MTNDPTQRQPSPFPAPEPGPVAGQPPYQSQPGGYPTQPPGPGMGQPTFASPGQPAQAPYGQPVVPSFIPPSVASAAANPKRRTGSSAGTLAFVVAVVVAAAGLGFAGGRLTAPAAATRSGFTGQNGGNFPGANPNASGNPNRGFGGLGGAFAGAISLDGQVTSVANGSITIQTANGQSVTLQVPSTATYHAQAPATSSDVTVGSKVQVSVSRPARAEGSAQPEASGQPGQGLGGGQGGFGLTVTDITVVGK